MFKNVGKRFAFIAVLALTLIVAACGGSDGDSESSGDNGDSSGGSNVGDGKSIELVYVEWDTEVASTHVIGKVLEDLGYDVTLTPLDNAVMWQSVANGESDAMVAAWLPATHGDLFEEYKDQVVDLGANFDGAKIGMVVPSYMDIDSIEDLPEVADELDQTITGIEPGAGVVKASENSVEEYGLDGWEVQTSSSGAMATALGEAIDNEEPIAVTGWSPHWKFAEYDLKYLEDPKEVYGGAEEIKTMARQGLEEDLPNAYKVLENFSWGEEKFNNVMLEIHNGTDPEEAAATFVEENQDLVDEWTADVE
ncbi:MULTISPECIES: glycine betaine ABC transporter substrate-binding protein [Allobacillus]|uniref:Glycine betaine ABC transporter substrate-binding protein n=1 Tax=Allobacillus halotolerans TaxID=570278 RepID=A0ABS6GTI2_9BACI|nr:MULTISPECIES: glycine betaine ABC transporter substrate-binding protein [Allobacillus]MBU6081637.1 glycine betaine ABC transporter substrate-binding protein [Allobacillus halotolerans]TSJ66342.1 glycine betaine ABC transporter substrate-binding protein [Allobacillus sp. SKP2-8]